MSRRRQRAAHSEEVNCVPLSLVMVSGTPKRWIHPEKRAAAHSAAVVPVSGTASGHRLVRSTIVKR
jgi:hypothetical protein